MPCLRGRGVVHTTVVAWGACLPQRRRPAQNPQHRTPKAERTGLSHPNMHSEGATALTAQPPVCLDSPADSHTRLCKLAWAGPWQSPQLCPMPCHAPLGPTACGEHHTGLSWTVCKTRSHMCAKTCVKKQSVHTTDPSLLYTNTMNQ